MDASRLFRDTAVGTGGGTVWEAIGIMSREEGVCDQAVQAKSIRTSAPDQEI